MVLAGKVFLVRENYEMDLLTEKLKSFKIETETTVEEQEFKLVSEIRDLSAGKGTLEGTFSFDSVFVVRHRGKAVPVPRTYEAPFTFDETRGRLFLTVYGIGPQTASRILAEMRDDEQAFYRDLLEAKIRFVTTRQFWSS